jgi:hypothetical protein
MTLAMLLSTALSISLAAFALAAPDAGNQTGLLECLKSKGYKPETMSDPNYHNDSAAFNQRLIFKPAALVYP